MIRDVCVYLDGSEQDQSRIAVAEQVATQFDALVAGIYVNALPEIPSTLGYDVGAVEIDSLQKAARMKGQKIASALRTRFGTLSTRNELRSHDVFESGVRDVYVEEARLFDLFVATRPYGKAGTGRDVSEAVLFGSGRASLMVPPGDASFDPGSIVIAWRNTREAARAVAEALPFLVRARSVMVVMVGNDELGGIERAAQGSDIARHLDRHGIKVDLNPVAHGPGVTDTLLEEARLAGAGMLVMGAYGHSRLREWILGGVTREILGRATIPVLVAH